MPPPRLRQRLDPARSLPRSLCHPRRRRSSLGAGRRASAVGLSSALAALGVVAWHYWRLRGVLRRLTARQRMPPPHGRRRVERARPPAPPQPAGNARAQAAPDRHAARATAPPPPALPDAVVVVDRNSQRVQWFNEAATPLLGLHYPRDIGAPLGERLQPMPLAHWLRGRPQCRTAAGRRPRPSIRRVRLSLRLIPVLRRTVAAGRARRHQAAATGTDAPRFRRQRLARTAHAADRRARLPRHARSGGTSRTGRRCWRRCSGSRSA